MKTKLSILLIGLTFGLTTKAQTGQEALNYMQQMSAEFQQIQSATWDYTRSVAKNKSANKVEQTRKDLENTIKNSISKVQKIPPFKGQSNFRDSVLSFLNINLAVVSNDYEKLMDLEEIKEQSYDMMDAYLKAQETANNHLAEAGQMVSNSERVFAKDNNINLIEGTDKIGEKLKKAEEVYDYYNPIYLIFFKVYKQEIYLIDALNRGDVAAMEQNKSSLGQLANEAISKMTTIKAYKNDSNLKNACENILSFYKEESEKHFQKLIDYYATKEAFEKAKTNLESKNERDRTKEDVDNYNKLVAEYNKATNTFNETNVELNKKRSKFLDVWNNESQNFTSKYID